MKYQLSYSLPDNSTMDITINLDDKTKNKMEYHKEIDIPLQYFQNPKKFLSKYLNYDDTQMTVFESQTLPEKMETLERKGLLKVKPEDALQYIINELKMSGRFPY